MGHLETIPKEVEVISNIERMKNVLFSFAFMLIGSLAFAHTNNTEIMAIGDGSIGQVMVADDALVVAEDVAVTTPEVAVDAPAGCWIVYVTVTCGGTYKTQYCNEGLHGTLSDWANRVEGWACEEQSN
jgi:hypothetical protein